MKKTLPLSPKVLASLIARQAPLPKPTPVEPIAVPHPRRRPRSAYRIVATVALLAVLAGIGLGTGHRAHSAGGAVAVQVTNTPLPTRDADNAARQPFVTQIKLTIPDGTDSSSSSFVVPAGKRLVVETVSMFRLGYIGPGQSVQLLVNTTCNSVTGYYELPYVAATTAYDPGISQPLRIYADPGSTVEIYPHRTGTSGTEYDYVTISGYLVDVP